MVAARRNGAPLRVARGGAVSPIVSADELRERIEAAFRERRATDTIGVGVRPVGASPHTPRSWLAHASIVSLRDGREDASWRCYAATEDDALMELAVAVGLNPDGSDPRAEVERLRAIVERHAAEKAQLVREAHEAMEATVAEAVRYYSAAKDRMQKKVDAACAERDAAIARAYAEERERDAVRDAAREYLDARAAYDVANAYDATNADDERRAWDRRAAAQGALAALVGGSK